MKKNIPEENFKIDFDLIKKVDNLYYKGVRTKYNKDTNTLIFSKDNDVTSDDNYLCTLFYRNYTVDEIKEYIEYNFQKTIYDELESMYSGYPTEDNYRKDLVNHIKNTKFDNMKNISNKLEYSLSPYDLIRLSNEYKKGNKEFNDKVEYLLTDINFHSECSDLINNKADDIINNSKFEIRKILEHYVLDKFITKYKVEPKYQGYLSSSSKELEDVSEYDCRYLQYEGYLRPTLNGYRLSDDYIKTLNFNKKKFKYVYWLKINSSNETKDGKEWLNLKKYKEKYDCNITVFYYDNSFVDKAIKLECNQNYEELDLDVNSMSCGSLIKLKSKPKNITVYKNDIEYFFNEKIKVEQDDLVI